MHRNFAGRAGRWSAAHGKTATFGWVALVLAAVALGMAAGTQKLTDTENSQGETARAERILADAGFDKSAEEAVLVQRGTARLRPARSRPRCRRCSGHGMTSRT
jgi:putative drug exporter of the RND superfamily